LWSPLPASGWESESRCCMTGYRWSDPTTAVRPVSFPGLWVWQLGIDREVWTVKCSHPMEFSGEEIPLITPGEAWEKLLRNEFLVYVEGFFGGIPGARFAASQSRVTDVKLVCLPRHPQLVRNEQYDLMYLFAGEAQVGNRRIEFAACVEARKPE